MTMRVARGSIVALVTPMNERGEIDYPAIDRLIEWHIASKTAGIVAVGTTGESATLSVDEHCTVITRVVRSVAGRVPVIAGTGANATREAIDLTQAAKEHGADACLLVTPYYNKPTQEGLYQHHASVARNVPIPQILYNVPSRTACDMQAETVARLAQVDNIIGIKEATGEVERAKEIMRLCPDNFLVYSGDDVSATRLMAAGAQGVISVTANIAPNTMAKVSALALEKKHEEAQECEAQLRNLHNDLFVEPNPIPIKWLMAQAKMIGTGIRLPLTPLAEAHHATLEDALHTVLADEIDSYHASCRVH